MSKDTTIYICTECGNESLAWQGKCNYCQTWNSLKEITNKMIDVSKGGSDHLTWINQGIEIIDLDQDITKATLSKIKLDEELDRVLGGGLIEGSVVLLSGEPGIGKSTLLLQITALFARVQQPIYYISGEEGMAQIADRAKRLNLNKAGIKIANLANVDQIIKIIAEQKPKLVVVDSIQTIYDPEFPSAPGSLMQVKQSALKLTRITKSLNISLIITSHVTKEGMLAGPRTLEHLVDVVLYLEGERLHNLRLLRGIKNRYGPTDEVGVFEMKQTGLQPITNPSEILLAERKNNLPGSVITAAMEGLRPLLLEVQALTTPSHFGYPKRSGIGINADRLELILAVLEKKAKIRVSQYDIFCSLIGGLSIKDPAIDLAIAMAITSSIKNKAVDQKLIFFGEIGLTGEIRRARFTDRREKEAERFNLKIINGKDLNLVINDVFGLSH